MHLSPQSQEVVERLGRREKLESADITLGPFDEMVAEFLEVFVAHYDDLFGRKGTDQANALRNAWSEHQKPKADQEEAGTGSVSISPPIPGASESDTCDLVGLSTEPVPRQWRLIAMTCVSIRGVAPPGELFEFRFEGKSNLVFGPNGSGKSSLLGAVVWVLTGNILTDSDDKAEHAPMYDTPKESVTGAKVREWPVAVTLPEDTHFRTTDPSGWAQIELRSVDAAMTLHLRRHYGAGLEVSDDGENWEACPNLAEHGIEPLDLQLSLVSPTVFGRQSVEVAKDTRSLLGQMLGYDDLEHLGDLASKISGNRTRLAKAEGQSISTQWDELRTQLEPLPGQLPDDEKCKVDVSTLAAKVSPSGVAIAAVETKLNAAIESAEKSLVQLLGLKLTEDSPPAGLAEKLTVAVLSLEKGVWATFPTLAAIKLDAVLPSTEEASSSALLDALAKEMKLFFVDAAARIAKRLDWWEKESAPESKLALLLRAAQDYDSEALQCPVCDQPIDHLPIKDELASLKGADPELRKELKTFFTDLGEELEVIIPTSVSNVAAQPVSQRILDDWGNLRDEVLGEMFGPITECYEAPIQTIADDVQVIEGVMPPLLPKTADGKFRELSVDFVNKVALALKALAVLQWSRIHVDGIADSLGKTITKETTAGEPSLLSALSKGKQAAATMGPLAAIRDQLSQVKTKREAIAKTQAKLATLEEIEAPLDQMKTLAKFAASEVGCIFESIKDKTIEYWKMLYPESTTGMKPGRLTMGKGRDKSIEALLSRGRYEVPGQYFANAGLQRAIALSFYFALLEKHPRGLGFVLMDDPILSLDEDHRERWSHNILRPKLEDVQIILATHQRQYLLNCGCDFDPEYVVELNPRDRGGGISRRPGHRLRRAEREMVSNWDVTLIIMRKYREEVLITLDAYSPEPFFNPANLTSSFNDYAHFAKPHPLASRAQRRIVHTFKDPKVDKVMDPAAHALTESNVSKPMAEDCLRKLLERDSTFRNELKRLERLRLHRLRGSAIPMALIPFHDGPLPTLWSEPFGLQTVGRAAARMGDWMVDLAEEPGQVLIPPGGAVLVASDSLDPVAKFGQWVLLAGHDVDPNDGDLVAAIDENGNRYLRRIWSEGQRWVMHPINPVHPTPTVSGAKFTAAVRKVIGVLYHPSTVSSFSGTPGSTVEWDPYATFNPATIGELRTVEVEGDSLAPIARRGQKVLVAQGQPHTEAIVSGSLAVVETDDNNIGNVIKRVFPGRGSWILVSPNPVDAVCPLIVPVAQIRRVWPLRGVLFEFGEASDSENPET